MTIWVKNIAKQISLIAALLLLAGPRYAHAQTVPIPNPDWPLDSVVNRSVHRYTVPGDKNYSSPSQFVWHVEGGRLFFDQALTAIAGNGITDTVVGNTNNITTMWVVWDTFVQPLDTGYVYVYEISADGCQRSDNDPGKFSGMRIKVSAPPDVYFLTHETLTCSNENGVTIDIAIDGMPPFDLKYRINGVVHERHIEPNDLIDSDLDGNVNNVTILIDDYFGTTSDMIYQLELLEASSGGVLGKVLDHRSHTVYAFVQPAAPVIRTDWAEVTIGMSHDYHLTDRGENPAIMYWELYDVSSGEIVFEFSSPTQPFASITFDFVPGFYTLVAYYVSINGCISLTDSHNIELFDVPTIAFSDISLSALGCSQSSSTPDEFFEFIIDYKGARTFNFSYAIYDYNGSLLEEIELQNQTDRNTIIIVPNNFVNLELPEINRAWKVKIVQVGNAENADVEILDSDIEGGRDERLIYIHPKPVIHEDIDFAN